MVHREKPSGSAGKRKEKTEKRKKEKKRKKKIHCNISKEGSLADYARCHKVFRSEILGR